MCPWGRAVWISITGAKSGAWRSLPVGEKRRYTFPAGSFDFISAHADAIGAYLICSLFSPLLEFGFESAVMMEDDIEFCVFHSKSVARG